MQRKAYFDALADGRQAGVFDQLIEETHRQVDEIRRRKGLKPWKWNAARR